MNILTKHTLDKGNTPKDILMIRRLIENEGIEEYEKNTLNFISEYLNSYVLEILSDSKQCASLAERHKINIEDVKMVIKSKQTNMHNKKIEVNLLKEIAKEGNSIPLPNIPDTPKILLPPPEHSLIRSNFQIFSEDILQSFNNPVESPAIHESRIHEDLDFSKKQTMIGLKRKDYDDRPNVVLSKKKMRLSASREDVRAVKIGVIPGHGFRPNTSALNQHTQHNANGNNNVAKIRKQSIEKIDFDVNENDDESMSNYNYNNDFIMNNENNSEAEDYNYDINF